MSQYPWGILPLIVFIAFAIPAARMFFARAASRRRAEPLAALASRLGYAFDTLGLTGFPHPPPGAEGLRHLPPFRDPQRTTYRNLLRHERALVFDYSAMGGAHAGEHSVAAFALGHPDAVPEFAVLPPGARDPRPPVALSAGPEIGRHTVVGGDTERVRGALTDAVRARLAAVDEPEFRLDAGFGWLAFSVPRLLAPAELERFLATAVELRDLLAPREASLDEVRKKAPRATP